MDSDRAHSRHSSNAPVITNLQPAERIQARDNLPNNLDHNGEAASSPPNVTPPSHFMLHMPETAEEVKQRRQAIRDRTQELRDSLQTSIKQKPDPDNLQRVPASGNASNVSSKPLARHTRTAISDTGAEQFAPRPQPPTPPRRRPPLANGQSGASGYSRPTQITFGDDGQVRDEEPRGKSPDTQPRVQTEEQADRPSVPPPDNAKLEGGSPALPSLARTESGSSSRDSRDLHRQQTLHRLNGTEQLAGGEHVGDSRAISPLAVRIPYVLGNRGAGFNSGNYVTILEQPEQKKPKEKEGFMKRAMRFLRNGRK